MGQRSKNCAAQFLLVGCFMVTNCSRPPTRDFDITAELPTAMLLGIGNFTVVEIDPNGHRPILHWEAFNSSGNADNVPYEILTVTSGDERYVVTDKTVGNNELLVNGVTYSFDGNAQRIRIRIGEGVDIAGGADYKSATKYWTFNTATPADHP